VFTNALKEYLKVAIILLIPLVTACTQPLPPAGPPEPTFPLPSTEGGLGGRVLKVTNLNADGPGSLQAGLQAQGPRIIVRPSPSLVDRELSKIDTADSSVVHKSPG
jgi:hypothetical protein